MLHAAIILLVLRKLKTSIFPPLLLQLSHKPWYTYVMPKYVWSVLNLQKALSFYDVVFDAVYAPKVTRLLREAEECGVKVVSGVEMFIRQAMGQFEHFTGGIEGVMFF